MTGAEAIAAVLPVGTVAVEGDGPRAGALRSLLAVRLANAGQRPAVIIETTGEEAAIQRALAAVDDLGTVVLAGPAPARDFPLDLYPDVHLRGLTLLGVGAEEAV
ncbi:MAG: hypothetical protein QOK21_2820 [Solirubrobacteraceae bacterium]|jgi:threonine dehydrogenase-like Zn-dependent dehydrogenase|nr:hypothetical protein [Solirubrobacteraceae bacterium]